MAEVSRLDQLRGDPIVVLSRYQLTVKPSPTGDLIVTRSIELGQPVIYVSMNYRWAFVTLRDTNGF